MTMYISTPTQHAKVLELLNELVLYTTPDGMKILATALDTLRSLEPCDPVAWMVDKVNDRQFVYDERMLDLLDPKLKALSKPLYAAKGTTEWREACTMTQNIKDLADEYATAVAQQGEAHDHIARDKLHAAIDAAMKEQT